MSNIIILSNGEIINLDRVDHIEPHSDGHATIYFNRGYIDFYGSRNFTNKNFNTTVPAYTGYQEIKALIEQQFLNKGEAK